MSLHVEVTGIKELQDELNKIKNQGAVVDALNHTVSGARIRVRNVMDQVFSPKAHPYVKDGIRTETADIVHLRATVYISEFASGKAGLSPAQILAPHIFGGGRLPKASERSLRAWYSDVFSYGQFLTPGPGAARDAYGNISGQEMIKIKSGAGISEKGNAYKMNITPRSKKRNKKAYGNLFVSPRVGVFRRLGPNSVIPVLFFSRPPVYRKRFPFYETVREHAQKTFLKNMIQALGFRTGRR